MMFFGHVYYYVILRSCNWKRKRVGLSIRDPYENCDKWEKQCNKRINRKSENFKIAGIKSSNDILQDERSQCSRSHNLFPPQKPHLFFRLGINSGIFLKIQLQQLVRTWYLIWIWNQTSKEYDYGIKYWKNSIRF